MIVKLDGVLFEPSRSSAPYARFPRMSSLRSDFDNGRRGVWCLVALLSAFAASLGCRPAVKSVHPPALAPESENTQERENPTPVQDLESEISSSKAPVTSNVHELLLSKKELILKLQMAQKPTFVEEKNGSWTFRGALSKAHPEVACNIEGSAVIMPLVLADASESSDETTRRGFDWDTEGVSTVWSRTEVPNLSGKEEQVIVSNNGFDVLACSSKKAGDFDEFLRFVRSLAEQLQFARSRFSDEAELARLEFRVSDFQDADGRDVQIDEYMQAEQMGVSVDIRSINTLHEAEGKGTNFLTETCIRTRNERGPDNFLQYVRHRNGGLVHVASYVFDGLKAYRSEMTPKSDQAEKLQVDLKYPPYTRSQRKRCIRFLLEQSNARDCRYSAFGVREGKLGFEEVTLTVQDRAKKTLRARSKSRDLMLWVRRDGEVYGVAEYGKAAKGRSEEQLQIWNRMPCPG